MAVFVKMAKNDENEHFSDENPKNWVLHLHNSMKQGQTQLLGCFYPLTGKNNDFFTQKTAPKGKRVIDIPKKCIFPNTLSQFSQKVLGISPRNQNE